MSTSLRTAGGVLHGGAQRDATVERVADKIGPVDADPLHQRRDILRHQFEAQGAIDFSGAPMGLQMDRDDLAAVGECRRKGPNISLAPPLPCNRISGFPVPWPRNTF